MVNQLSSAALRKVSKELQSLQTSPPEGIRIQVDEANLSNLTGWIGKQTQLGLVRCLLAVSPAVQDSGEAACLLTGFDYGLYRYSFSSTNGCCALKRGPRELHSKVCTTHLACSPRVLLLIAKPSHRDRRYRRLLQDQDKPRRLGFPKYTTKM